MCRADSAEVDALPRDSYPGQLASLLFDRSHSVGRRRMRINGYRETGTTTTPWSMLALNQTDRFTLAEQALEMGELSTFAMIYNCGEVY